MPGTGRRASACDGRGLTLYADGVIRVELPRAESDRILKTAASVLAAHKLCTTLGLKPDEEHFRFGFTV